MVAASGLGHWLDLAQRLPPEGVRVRFADDLLCHDRLVAIRWPGRGPERRSERGPVCPVCRAQPCWFLPSRRLFSCPAGHQFSVISGTALHGSHLPLTIWFAAAERIILDHRRFHRLVTTRALSLHLGISYSATHRLRRILVADLEGNGLICRAVCIAPPGLGLQMPQPE